MQHRNIPDNGSLEIGNKFYKNDREDVLKNFLICHRIPVVSLVSKASSDHGEDTFSAFWCIRFEFIFYSASFRFLKSHSFKLFLHFIPFPIVCSLNQSLSLQRRYLSVLQLHLLTSTSHACEAPPPLYPSFETETEKEEKCSPLVFYAGFIFCLFVSYRRGVILRVLFWDDHKNAHSTARDARCIQEKSLVFAATFKIYRRWKVIIFSDL